MKAVSPVVLALDSGSQSSRALLFDADGQILGQGSRAHGPMAYPSVGAVEQDPVDIRDSLFFATRECLEGWGGDPARLQAAALTSQRTTMLATDGAGEPITAAISWLDRRLADRTKLESPPARVISAVLTRLRQPSLPRIVASSRGNLLREHYPDALSDLRWFTVLEAWLLHQLCGEMRMAVGGMAGVVPADMPQRRWSPHGFLHRLLGFEPGWLPEVVEAGELIGRVHADAARCTGLPEGLPLYACGGDKQAEALGAGVLPSRPGVAAVSLGTASSISVPSLKPRASQTFEWITCCSVVPGVWHLEYMVFRGMWTVAWFAREFGRDLEPKARARGVPVEALLCEEAATVEAGSEGVVTWPRWSPSPESPIDTGTMMGLREVHGRAHLFRSILEGIAMDLRRGREILERATGQKLREVQVGGGGARSDVVVEILADVLNLPVVCPPSEELSARGAAMVAAVAGGLHPDMESAVARMVHPGTRVDPDSARARRYDRIYREVFVPGLVQTRRLARALALTQG